MEKQIKIKDKEIIDKIIEIKVNEELKKRKEKIIDLIGDIVIISIISCFMILFLGSLYLFLIDIPNDEKACRIYLQGSLSDRDLKIKNCYATNDDLKFNFQKDLDCNCFYYDKYDYFDNYIGSFDWLKVKKFHIN